MRYLKLALLAGAWAVSARALAQNEGRSVDLGGFVGASYYHGDAGAGVLSRPQPALGLSLRLNRNLRWVWHGSLHYQGLRGSTQGLGYSFPRESSFASNVLTLTWGAEYHWYPYGAQRSYLGTRGWTPYLGGGVGLSTAWQEQVLLSPQLYATAGVKIQLKPRLQLVLAYTWQYHTSDRLDALTSQSDLGQAFGQPAQALRHGDASSLISIGLSWKLKYKYLNCN